MFARRLKVFTRDGWKCQYCGCAVAIYAGRKEVAPDSATIDHVHPRSKGGRSTMSNLLTACYRCNQEKADKTVEPDGYTAPTLADVWPLTGP